MCDLADWLLVIAPGLPDSIAESSLDEGPTGPDGRGCCLLRGHQGEFRPSRLLVRSNTIHVSYLLMHGLQTTPNPSGFKHNSHVFHHVVCGSADWARLSWVVRPPVSAGLLREPLICGTWGVTGFTHSCGSWPVVGHESIIQQALPGSFPR